MSAHPAVSVVIVSRGRPALLRRCLVAVGQLRYARFEVVVVADGAGRAILPGLPQAAHVKLVGCDEANISVARNLGIAAAAGEVVAFIDDDAVPEPTWLCHLAAPFTDPQVMAAGGFVRGRNGISWQSRAQAVDATGTCRPLELDAERVTVLTPAPGRAIRTEGTNMAVRRSCLAALGGFDPRYRFFLDETDLNLRLARQGGCTAIVPRAEVHHGFAASSRRRGDRAPTDLHEIGASWAVFLNSHCPAVRRAGVWQGVVADQRARLLGLMVQGAIEPRDVRRLLRGLADGYAEGGARPSPAQPDLTEPQGGFRAFPSVRDAPVLLAGRVWQRRRLRARARHLVAAGKVTTVIRLSPTALYHRVCFRPDGIWEQVGGVFGKSERNQRAFALWTFSGRVRAELQRVALVRGFTGQGRERHSAENSLGLSYFRKMG